MVSDNSRRRSDCERRSHRPPTIRCSSGNWRAAVTKSLKRMMSALTWGVAESPMTSEQHGAQSLERLI